MNPVETTLKKMGKEGKRPKKEMLALFFRAVLR